jgi:hypothetical protein
MWASVYWPRTGLGRFSDKRSRMSSLTRSFAAIAALCLLGLATVTCGGAKDEGAVAPGGDSEKTSDGTATSGEGFLPGEKEGPRPIAAPEDPLPKPAPLPAGTTDYAASLLARQVLGGGDDALPALLTALQASGTAVRGPGDELIVKPAEPWQGLIIDSWEIQTLFVTALPERAVSIGLADLAGLLREVAPELKGVAIEQLIVEDIRALASGPKSPRQFWAQFVIELGRTPIDPQTDLMGDVDYANVQINGLQSALILRRLELDLLLLAEGGATRGLPDMGRQPGQLAPALTSSLPCTLDDTARTVTDIAAFASKVGISGISVGGYGFGGLLGVMQRSGFSGVEQFKSARKYSSILLAYARFIAIYSALEATITMDSPPLTRTKQAKPQSGEQKELTAVVRLNIGNAQMLNCFRIMLNAVGMDFSLPNDGPVKGAQVAWDGYEGFSEAAAVLHGGPEQIVRFAGDSAGRIQSGGGASSKNAVTNAVTDADGKVKVSVEGVGQRQRMSNDARQVMKKARVRVDVALKGADFFKDFKDAAKSALGGVGLLATLPLDLLYRMKWASVGHYAFDVADWSEGPPIWTGTITYNETTHVNYADGIRSGQGDTTFVIQVQSQEADPQNLGYGNIARMKGTINGSFEQEEMVAQSPVLHSCNKDWTLQESASSTLAGSGGGEASITVEINGLRYRIEAHPASDLQFTVTGESSTKKQNLRAVGSGCNQEIETKTTSYPLEHSMGLQGVFAEGEIDPDDADHISGSVTTTEGNKTTTITWSLQRE